MLNQVILVGRIIYEPELKQTEDGRDKTVITLGIQRPYKNDEGGYETDFIPVTLWNGVAHQTVQYCHKGSIVGVKCALRQRTYEIDENNVFTYPEAVAEKITFINTKKED